MIQGCIGCDGECLYTCDTACANNCTGNTEDTTIHTCNGLCTATGAVASIIGGK